MHNIELFMEKCTFSENIFTQPSLYEEFNIYLFPERRINIYDIVYFKNKIISKINNDIYYEHRGRLDTNLFYYPGYYISKRPLFPIVFFLKVKEFSDKLSILLFECLCYHLIKELNYGVFINHSEFKKNILTEEILCSCINYLYAGIKYSEKEFERVFNYEISGNHFRKYIKYEETRKPEFLSILFTDLNNFLKYFLIDERYMEEFANVAIELIGNACEHTKTDCLFDIDIADNYKKKDKNGEFRGKYYAVNISIVNFSNKLFYY